MQPLSGLRRLFSRFSGDFFRIDFFQRFGFQLDGVLFHRLGIMAVGRIHPMPPSWSRLPDRAKFDVVGRKTVVFVVQVQSSSDG